MARKRKRRSMGEGTVYKRKDGRYEARTPYFTDRQGVRRRKVFYGATEGEALKKLFAGRVALGAGMTFEADRTTLREYVEEWLRVRGATVKASTLRAYRHALGAHDGIATKTLAELRPALLRRHQASLHDDGMSDAMISKAIGCLSSVLRTAVDDEILNRNPLQGVKRVQAPRPPITVWEESDLHRFLGELPPDTTAYALFYTAAFTGARRGELLGLRWEDLSVDQQHSGKLRIERSIVPSKGKSSEMTTPKTDTSIRSILISHDVVRVLQRHRDRIIERSEELGDIWVDTNAIFPSEVGTYLSPHNASRLFRYWVKKTKAPRLSLHGLRHTHASLLIARGHSPKAVSERLGHASVKFTIDRYQHLYDRQRRATAIGIDDLIGAPSIVEEDATEPGIERLASIDE